MIKKYVDRTGQRYGKLVILQRAPNVSNGLTDWICQCDCGKIKTILGGNISSGRQVSCGCHSRETARKNKIIHGMTETKIYKVWSCMHTRCYNKKCKAYKHYGGRGIAVCDRWKEDFMNFYNDMASTYMEGLEIDRIDVNGNYEKENCRWITQKQNANNRRNTTYLTINGVVRPLGELATETGQPSVKIHNRLKRGWSHEEALFGRKKKQKL